MPSENVNLVRSIYADWERGDFSSVEWAHAEIECVSDEPLVPLDATGIAELGRVWGNWLHAWNGFHIDADGYREVDGERVLALLRYGGRDRLDGQEVMPIEAATLFHVRDGKVARLVIYGTATAPSPTSASPRRTNPCDGLGEPEPRTLDLGGVGARLTGLQDAGNDRECFTCRMGGASVCPKYGGTAMRAFTALPAVAVAAGLIALAGCGSTNKTATTTAASSVAAPTTTTSGAPQAVKTTTYNINLAHVSGSSGGANASGLVILSVKAPNDELCWNISPVKNFTISSSKTQATIVTIQPTPSGTPSTPGIPLGFAYKSAGCVHAPSTFLERLQAHPQMFYLSIYNTQSGDAVRGQV